MKVTSLKELYELNKRYILVLMPLTSVAFAIAGFVIILIWTEIWWGGLIFFGIAGILAIMCFFMVKYMNKKIEELIEYEYKKTHGENTD